MKTDEQLVEAAQKGSEAAFSELVSRYREKLFRFMITRCHSHADAEDTVQDAFINAFRYLHTFNPRWRFSTWLYRIAIRNAMRQPAGGVPQAAEIADHADPLQECIVSGDRENMWLTAKQVLAPDAFSAMWLHYIEDMPVKDISQALDRSASWTKVTMLRSRRRLTKELRQESAEAAGSKSYG